MSRRLYRRRADTMVFVTIAVVLVGVVAVYSEMQERLGGETAPDAPRSAEPAPPSERLVVLATDEQATLLFERDRLAAALPFFLSALDEANDTGSGVVTEPMLIDMVWAHLLEDHGAAVRVPVTAALDGETYRVQSTD